jgi:ABC-type branched-subunit amino acid transport system substrate-binding protein
VIGRKTSTTNHHLLDSFNNQFMSDTPAGRSARSKYLDVTEGTMRRNTLLATLMVAALALGLACGDGEGGRTGVGSQATPAAGGATTARVPGVSQTEIKVGTHTPLTGPVAVYSVIPKTVKAYFDQVNEQGGVEGRKITFLMEDDAYSPPKAVEVTRKLVEQDNIFAMLLGLGTPPHTAVADYLKQNNVPDIFPSTGAVKWCQPPQASTFCFQLPYNIAGKIMGKYAGDNFNGKRVGFIYQNDDFGLDEMNAFKEAGQGKLQFGPQEAFEPTATNLNAQVLNLRNANVDLAVCICLPTHTAAAIKFAKQQGWSPQWIVSEVNADPVVIRLAGADVMEGVITNGYLKLPDDPNDPDVQKHLDLLKKYAPDVQPGGNSVYAHAAAEVFVELLKRTGANLTRENLIKTANDFKDFKCSLCLAPVSMSNNDHLTIDGSRIAQVKNGRWQFISDYITADK